MPTTQLSPSPVLRVYDNSNNLAVGGFVYTYAAGTSTLQATYTDSTGVTPNTNPIILNSRGECSMWLAQGQSYKIVAFDASSNLLWSKDNIDNTNLAASTGSSQVGFIQAGAGAVATTAQAKMRETVSARDFGADPLGVIDATAAIQNAINSLPSSGGILLCVGTFKISGTLTVNKPVILQGVGEGDPGSPDSPASSFVWAGGASPMINMGGFGITYYGGGIKNLTLNGSALATYCLVTKDLQRAEFSSVVMSNAVTGGWLMTNTPGQIVTGFFICDDVRIVLRGGSTQNAHGIIIQGVHSAGSDGVTLCMMRRVRVEHANGHGILVGSGLIGTVDAADNFVWDGLFTFRADVETGYGVFFAAINTSSICTAHTFYSPLCNGGFYFGTAGLNLGTNIVLAEDGDISATVTNLIYGAGCVDVNCTTQSGAAFGRGVLQSSRYSNSFIDSMSFVAFVSASNYLLTGNSAWVTAAVGTPAITDSGIAGGAITISTGATSNNTTSVYKANLVSANNFPMAVMAATLPSIANLAAGWGFFDAPIGSATNGVYVIYNSAVSAFFQIVTVKASVVTTVTTTVSPVANVPFELIIKYDVSFAVFQYRANGSTAIITLGTITTNIPLVVLHAGTTVITETSSAKSQFLQTVRIGYVDETAYTN